MSTYGAVLARINEFMEKSGIRALCSETCKGHCCGGRQQEGKCNKLIACHDKLPCVCYICTPLRHCLLEIIPNEYKEEFFKGILFFRGEVENLVYKRVSGNSYFTAYALSDVEDIEFEYTFNIPPEAIEKIRIEVDKLRNRLLKIDDGYGGFFHIIGKKEAFFY